MQVARPTEPEQSTGTSDSPMSPSPDYAAPVTLHVVRKPLGSVRVSLGYMSRVEDVEALVQFLIDEFQVA